MKFVAADFWEACDEDGYETYAELANKKLFEWACNHKSCQSPDNCDLCSLKFEVFNEGSKPESKGEK